MEGEKKNDGRRHRRQYSRKPQHFQEHSANTGRENVEKETANSLNNPARKKYVIPQHEKDYNVAGSQIGTKGGVGTRCSVERLERDHGNLHCWENTYRHNDANDEDTAEGGDEEDSELHTAEDGDNEDDYTEDDTSNDEDGAGNQDLQVQILLKLQELIEAQESSDNGKANKSAGESKPDNRRKNLKDLPTTGHNGPYAGKSSTKSFQCSSSVNSTHDQINCNRGFEEENRLRGHLAEGTSTKPQNPRKNQGERLEIRFPIPQNLRRFDWLVKSSQKFELGTMGYSYDGGIADRKMHGYGRLMLNDRGDFIAGNWDGNRLMDLKSCQLFYRQKTINIVRRIDDYLLTLYENHFVAVVMMNSTDQLDFYKSIPQFKDAFFGKITTLEVLQDGLKNRREASLQEFESSLCNMIAVTADPVLRANIFILLRRYSTNNSNFTLSDFLNDLYFPPALRKAAINLQTSDAVYRSLYNSFAFLKEKIVPLDMRTVLANIYKVSIQQYRDTLISGCPGSLPCLISDLQNLDDSKIAYATQADIDIFCQLVSQPFFQHYKECIENLAMRYGQALNKITPHTLPPSIIPLMSPVFECLVRSLWEIISEIIDCADGFTCKRMLKCESGNWKIEQNIQPSKWAPKKQNYNARKPDGEHSSTSENKSLFYHRSLEVQYKLVLEMLKHIFPDNRIAMKRFDYKFCVLEQDQREGNWLWNGMQKYWRKGRGLPERFKDLSEERLVWLYMLDHTIHEVFKGDPKYQDVLWQYNPLLQGTVQFIQNSPTESHESFRALTHNVVKLVTSSAPYIRVTAEKLGVDVNLDNLGVDVEILFQHISTATQNIDRDPLAFSNFRDLITEYNKYLRLRHFIEIKAAPGFFSAQLSQIMQTFMRIVEISLKKSVPVTALVVYFRCLNDFLHDFRNIDFLGMWYVKTVGCVCVWEYGNQVCYARCYDERVIEKVENKLSSGKKCSYLVKNIEKFVAEYDVGSDLSPPRHYTIEIVTELLGYIEKCLDKRWQSKDEELQLVQLKTTGVLLDAIRRSFMYLKEQPDYVDFEAFRKESVDPFARLVDECSTLNDLKNRTEIVKESFWYLRKMDEIDIDQALTLLKDLNMKMNTCRDAGILLNCYNLYLSHYNKYIEKYSSVLSGGDSHFDGIDAVKQMLKKVNHLHFSKWTKQFKTNEIPILLAGLSAIWSISVSKDLSSTGKFLKPHCIQILCILRLLSVGQPSSTDNHLAQVLTGQGKSVILGLLSSILALTGHKVRVLCYSAYLSSRDQTDFGDFFLTFGINCNIVYGTFEDMAKEFLTPTCNGRQKSLGRLVEDRVLNHANWSAVGSVTTESKNTVLLFDEVDVFFTENFYGNTYRQGVSLGFRGLAVVQEKIWSLATKHYTEQEINDHIKAFMGNIATAGSVLLDLHLFLSKPGTFSLLKGKGRNLTVKNYTNQSLFDEHLLEMINTAVSVAATSDYLRDKVQFMINSEGLIRGRASDNIYDEEWKTSFWGYWNTFNYFKLKGSNFDHKDLKNYGYLHLKTGNISYSLLPSQFRLILGVSGTIENLSEYEKTGIKSYNIHNTTILPSFYGESNLLFNKHTDFHYYTEKQEWLKKLYYRASSIVQSNRAVLIFFESDLVIDLFTKEYRTKFDRLNEISANTQAHLRDKYIEEAGLPGALTLATRVMGRGVDFKSSLSVEKHGGVHVIQTFFSKDIKEEIQIKGRTARKDNMGSFEIVICKEHLVREGIISAHDQTIHNYAALDEIRRRLSESSGEAVIDKIKQSEQDHETTMKYFGLA